MAPLNIVRLQTLVVFTSSSTWRRKTFGSRYRGSGRAASENFSRYFAVTSKCNFCVTSYWTTRDKSVERTKSSKSVQLIVLY